MVLPFRKIERASSAAEMIGKSKERPKSSIREMLEQYRGEEDDEENKGVKSVKSTTPVVEKAFDKIDLDEYVNLEEEEIKKLEESQIFRFLGRYLSSIGHNLDEIDEPMVRKFFRVEEFQDMAEASKLRQQATSIRKEYQKKSDEVLREIKKLEQTLKSYTFLEGQKRELEKKRIENLLKKKRREACEHQLEVWRADKTLQAVEAYIEERGVPEIKAV